jgi:hypothetical protein
MARYFKNVSLLFQRTIIRNHAYVYRGEKMKQRKILIILATAATLTIALFGVAYASYINYANNYTSYQTNTETNTTYTTAPRNDFWGWLGECFGWGTNQPYNGYQYQTPSNNTTQPPQTYVPPAYPNQGYYPYRTGRGCWGW